MSALLTAAIDTIRARQNEFEARFGLRLIGVAGSVARGDDVDGSDIDIVFDIAGRPTLFDLSDAQRELEQALGRAVDLVDRHALRPQARQFIERDLVAA